MKTSTNHFASSRVQNVRYCFSRFQEGLVSRGQDINPMHFRAVEDMQVDHLLETFAYVRKYNLSNAADMLSYLSLSLSHGHVLSLRRRSNDGSWQHQQNLSSNSEGCCEDSTSAVPFDEVLH